VNAAAKGHEAFIERGASDDLSGSSRAWTQPSHDHFVRRSAAAWQAVSLDRGFCKSQCLLAGLSFLARKCHPFANDGASQLWLGHLDSLSRRYAAFWTG
jgi:hypothetical protein